MPVLQLRRHSMPRRKLPLTKCCGASTEASTILAWLYTVPELSALSRADLQEFAESLADAVAFASVGFPVQRSDVGGLGPVKQILTADVVRAMRARNLPISCSRRYYASGGKLCESLVFQICRKMSTLVRVRLEADHHTALPYPADPYELLQKALRITYS